MKIRTPKQYRNKLKKRKINKGMSAKHSAPKRRCVEMIDKRHRCLARPVDGQRCTKHGGVAPQVVKQALKKERRIQEAATEIAALPKKWVDGLTSMAEVGVKAGHAGSHDVLPAELQKPARDFGPHGQCKGESTSHRRCANKANADGYCRYHMPVED